MTQGSGVKKTTPGMKAAPYEGRFSSDWAPKIGKTTKVHLLDWACGMLKPVARSTFTSEGHGVLATADHALVLGTTLHEIQKGPIPFDDLRHCTDSGKLCFLIDIVTDAKNLLLALEVTRMKPPAEKSFYFHLLWIRWKLETGAIHSLIWRDTRDITPDGHTKGSIARKALRDVAEGR